MELYFKDLISEEASLEKLVDDLMLLVQGADEFAQATGANLSKASQYEVRTRLERLKDSCNRVKQHAVASALAADKVMHQYPYSSVGFAFSFGLLAGVIAGRR